MDLLPEGVQGPYLHTLEYSPLEPGVSEDKYYAPGIGHVLIVKQETGESEVLVSIEVDKDAAAHERIGWGIKKQTAGL